MIPWLRSETMAMIGAPPGRDAADATAARSFGRLAVWA
jgi:hypothetical protein